MGNVGDGGDGGDGRAGVKREGEERGLGGGGVACEGVEVCDQLERPDVVARGAHGGVGRAILLHIKRN